MSHHRDDLLPLLLAAPVLVLTAWWSLDEGGYGPEQWMPGTVAIGCLLAVAVWAVRNRIQSPSRAASAAVLAFGAYTLWSFASVLWADAPGAAWEGSQRSLLYLLCFSLSVLLPWTPRAVLIGVSAFVIVVTAVGVVTVVRLTGLDDPAALLIEARLAAPLGYQNATAALWTMAALPALGLAVHKDVAWILRGPLLAASGLLFGLAILTQSRGWLLTLPIIAVIALVIHPGRWRWIAGATMLAAAALAVYADLLEPYAVAGGARSVGTAPELRAALDEAALSLGLAVGALMVAGVGFRVLDLLERQARVRAVLLRVSRPLGLAVAISIIVAGGAGVVAASDGRPLERIDRAWTEFSEFEGTSGGEATSRFDGLGSTRYDFWRVAVDAWREHPVGGLGQDNFAQVYLVRRQTRFEEPRWTHSLPLRLLAHTGVVGAALFGLFLAAALWAAKPFRRASDGSQRKAAIAVALLPAIVWLVHGGVDWLWEFPALSAPALAFLGAAAALGRRDGGRRTARPRSRLLPVAVGTTSLVAVAVVVPTYVSARDVTWASANWREDPAQAFARLDRARALNPLAQRPSLVEGIIAVRLGELARARAAFIGAAEREPADWFARFQLGLIATADGDRQAARRQFLAARARNPRDALIATALDRVDSRRPVQFAEADRAFSERVERRLGR